MSSESRRASLSDARDQRSRGHVRAEIFQQRLEALASQDAAVHARLHEAVGEEGSDRAGHQWHRRLTQSRPDPDADRRGGSRGHGVMGLRAYDDRCRVPGARIRQRARLRIVHGQKHGCEVTTQVLVDHAPGHLQRHPRLETGLEVGAQRVAHEGGAGERAAPVAGHVAENEANSPARQREHVVEVSARARSVGRAVGHRGLQRAHALGHRWQQGGLKQSDLLQELAALALQAAVAEGREEVGEPEQDRKGREQGERDPDLFGHEREGVAKAGEYGAECLVRPGARCRQRARPPMRLSPALPAESPDTADSTAATSTGAAVAVAPSTAPGAAPVPGSGAAADALAGGADCDRWSGLGTGAALWDEGLRGQRARIRLSHRGRPLVRRRLAAGRLPRDLHCPGLTRG